LPWNDGVNAEHGYTKEGTMNGAPTGRTQPDVRGEVRTMAISQELLDILVCPICKTPVKMTADNAGLKCETCQRVYPVRDDIPVMLPEEAKVEKE
jgi:uncharacterized protein